MSHFHAARVQNTSLITKENIILLNFTLSLYSLDRTSMIVHDTKLIVVSWSL